MTLRQNDWTLGAYCASYCRFVDAHHSLEDDAIFPYLRHRDARLGPLLDRLADEHLVIRSLVRAAQSGALDLDGLAETGRLLADHVRFEERDLFPLIEGALRSGALATLGDEIGDRRTGSAPGRSS
jgi:hemerythrin-like domain-containing protein